ncbi:MAG: putative DsbA family dithiol-disulfide isomerase [Pseudorhodobacter sp.]|jgi:predicted DsbA family dithiol-disulfide isomerase
MIRLDIFSDPICPWCFIGKTYLDRALESRANHPFVIEWHPFQLNPTMPRGGMDRREYLETKFGGKANAVAFYSRIDETAKAAGLVVNFDKIQRTPNTLDALRLIHWAGLEGRQTAVISTLFRAYFTDGLDIGDPEVLTQIAGKAGMDMNVTARLLASDADADDISARDSDARQKGVSAVPTFLVAQQYVLSGAQPVHVWQEVIDEMTEQLDKTES